MNLLITSIGKRVQLIKHLKEKFNVIGVDAGELNPAKYFVDKFYRIPKANEMKYIDSLLEICQKEEIKVLIPLYEGEFEILNSSRKRFQEIGTVLMLSNDEILNICKDKQETYKFFLNSEINVPKVYFEEEIRNIILYGDIDKLPLIIKPRDGMGSDNVFKVNSINELEFFRNYIKDGIVQEYIAGDEYTVDVLVDLQGNPIYIVPRKRLEVRAGEVVKSCTVKDNNIINETEKVIKKLNELRNAEGLALMGPLTIQFFKDYKGNILLLEINPRFGGGVPLSFEAGADYGKKICEMVEEKELKYIKDFKEMTMLRYEDAVFEAIDN